MVLLVVHAVGDHHGLEHIDTTHGSACKEEAQPGKDHPYHRGLYIAVGDLKEHIQQSKRHGACNGIEVINALFLVLADQRRSNAHSDKLTQEHGGGDHSQAHQNAPVQTSRLAVGTRLQHIHKVAVGVIIGNQRHGNEHEQLNGTSKNTGNQNLAERLVLEHNFEVLGKGIFFLCLLHPLSGADAGKLKENSGDHGHNNHGQDKAVLRGLSLRVTLVYKNFSDHLGNLHHQHANAADTGNDTSQAQQLAAVVLVLRHQ